MPRRQHPGADHKARTGSCQPSLLFPTHRPNASPVKRSHCGGVSKQIRQTIAAAAINLFINFYGIAAPAMPFGCSASLHSLSYCLQFLRLRSGSYCVLHATSFIASYVSLHYTSFAAIHLLHGRAAHKPGTNHDIRAAPAIRKPMLQYSPGFIPLHYVIHSLQ